MTAIEKVYGEVAKQQGITKEQMEKISQSMFGCVATRFVNKEHYKPLRLQYLGLFYCKPGRLDILGKKGQL